MVTIVITGDNHLNLYNQKLGSKLAERRARIGKAWNQTIEYAIENKADIYINTGDLFDQLSPRNPPRASVINGYRRLREAGISSYIVAGNHEVPSSERDGLSPHALLRGAGLAHVFENRTDFDQKIETRDGVTISIAGMSYNKNLAPKDDPIEDKTIPAGADLNIAILHYSIEDIAPPIWEEPRIQKSSIERNQQIQLYAMGHIHEHLSTMIGDSHVVYPGGTEHYDFGECGKSTGFIVAEYTDGELSIEYVPVESQPMNQLKLHMSLLKHDKLTESILAEQKNASHPDGLLQLVLEGALPFKKYTEIDFTEINRQGINENYYFEYIDRIKPTGEDLDFTTTEGLNPRKRLEETALKAIEGSTGEDQKLWQQAMQYAVEYYQKERDA
ncbi:MAG: DNA repair exonuclease [Candidatus Bathyarchaeota archaeon]|nr:DNA repair exonuclease [Candidatus Bathyarchaeota archaeon]